MKTDEIVRPKRIEIFTSAQLTIPSKDFEEKTIQVKLEKNVSNHLLK